ncbi:MAG: dihydrofolate reductase [Anaerolineae bacterium]
MIDLKGIKINAVAAMDKNLAIGINDDLPWVLPDDSKLFRRETINRPLIMGRKTHEPMGRPLPKRTNIIMTRSKSYQAEGCLIAHTVEEALELAVENLTELNEISIGGGEVIYKLFMPYLTHMLLTHVDAEVKGDTWFPKWDEDEWNKVKTVHHPADEKHAYAFDICWYERAQ